MFQMTIASQHPVSTFGILMRLNELGKWRDFVRGDVTVRLVFVRPTNSGRFTAQTIKADAPRSLQSSVEHLPRLKRSAKEFLISNYIKTVGQLKKRMERDETLRSRYKAYVEEFEFRYILAQYNDRIVNIPQYVIPQPRKSPRL